MKKIGLNFMNYHGRILVSIDSLIDSFEKIGNTEAVDFIKYYANEFNLHANGMGDKTRSSFTLTPTTKE